MPHEKLLIILIDRSTDSSLQVAKDNISIFLESLSAESEIVVMPKAAANDRGYGECLKSILASSTSDYVITVDSDLSVPLNVVKELWERRHHSEIVIASRYSEGGSSEVSCMRRLFSKYLNLFCGSVLSLNIKDLSSGNRLYRSCAFRSFNYQSNDYDFLLESLIRAVCAGFSVSEFPISYQTRNSFPRYNNFFQFTLKYLLELKRMWSLRNSVDSADYDNRAYFSRIPLQRYWQRQRFQIITGYIPKDGKNILDIGCGSSRIAQSLPGMVALDIARHKLRFLRSSNQHLVQASTFNLPFANEIFDVMIHSEVIEHIAAGSEVFVEMNRVLKKGATLIVGTPDYGRIWWPIFEFFYDLILPNAYAQEHITHYTKDSLIQMLERNGFSPIEFSYILGGELIIKAVKI